MELSVFRDYISLVNFIPPFKGYDTSNILLYLRYFIIILFASQKLLNYCFNARHVLLIFHNSQLYSLCSYRAVTSATRYQSSRWDYRVINPWREVGGKVLADTARESRRAHFNWNSFPYSRCCSHVRSCRIDYADGRRKLYESVQCIRSTLKKKLKHRGL